MSAKVKTAACVLFVGDFISIFNLGRVQKGSIFNITRVCVFGEHIRANHRAFGRCPTLAAYTAKDVFTYDHKSPTSPHRDRKRQDGRQFEIKPAIGASGIFLRVIFARFGFSHGTLNKE